MFTNGRFGNSIVISINNVLVHERLDGWTGFPCRIGHRRRNLIDTLEERGFRFVFDTLKKFVKIFVRFENSFNIFLNQDLR